MSESGPLVVCIVCVVPVETEAVVRVFSRRLKRQFKKKFDQSVGEFREISLKNSRREVVRIVLSWLPRYGPVEMALHLPRLFNFFHPRFVVMPGICAGDPTKTSLGDLVLAERAFMYEEGKTTLSANDEVRHLPDTRTHEINDQLLTFAKAFREWQGAGHRLSRPQSMKSRRERVLAAVLSVKSKTINETSKKRLLRAIKDINAVIASLQGGSKPWLDESGHIVRSKEVQILRAGRDFPYVDPTRPTIHIKTLASGQAVREDRPFQRIQAPIRSAIAIDMEGAVLYRALKEHPEIEGVVIKGICDYADPDKDDSFQSYAATLAASYVFDLIRNYVTSERLGVAGKSLRTSAVRQSVSLSQYTSVLSRRLEVHSEVAAEDAVIVAAEETSGFGEAVRLDKGLYVHRKLEDSVLMALNSDEPPCVLVTGEAGVGKTSLLWRIRDHLSSKDGVQPIFMKATLLEGTHPAGKQDDRGMTADELLHATISLRSEDKQLVLILDTADLLLHEEASRDNLLYLLAGLRSQDCAVVIGSRLQEATLLKKSITHSLRLDNYDEEELKEAIQNHCKHLSRHALPEEAEAQVNRLLRIVARGLSLREICVNPLMLRMLFLLYSPEGVPEEIHSFQLYEHYWRRRVVEDVRAGSLRPVNRDNLELPACAVALAMTAEGTPEISERMAEHALERLHVPRECLEALYSRGVLKRVGVGRITFFHQTFFEHAAARAFVRGIVEFGVSLLESRTSANPDDLFVAPIYEHAVLLIERMPAKSHLADESLSRALQDSSVLRRISGIYIYCHRERVSRELEQKVLGLLRSEQDAVVFHFLRHAINWSAQRTNSLIDHLHAIWIRNQWSEREQVISLLERLAFRIPADVRKFLIEEKTGDYVTRLPIDYPGEREFLRVILALANHFPQWAWEQLLWLQRSRGKAVSLDLVTAIVSGVADAKGVFPRDAASVLETSLLQLRRDEVRGFKTLVKAFARLWTNLWVDSGWNFQKILQALHTEPGNPLRMARFIALADWLRAVSEPEYNEVLNRAQSASGEEMWLWTSAVLWGVLRPPDWPGRSAFIEAVGSWIEALWGEKRYRQLEQILRALLDPSIEPHVIRELFSATEFKRPEPWLDPNSFGRYLAHGLIAEHPGALLVVSDLTSDSTVCPTEVRDALLGRLTNHVSGDQKLADMYLRVSLTGSLPTGFGTALTRALESWPDTVAKYRTILDQEKIELLKSPRVYDRTLALVIWEKLVSSQLIPTPEVSEILTLMKRDKGPETRAGFVAVLTLAAEKSNDVLDPVLEELQRLSTDASAEVRTRAIRGLSRVTARSKADACRHGLRVLDMVLKSDPQSDRISELGAVLTAMASGCPENAEQFLYSLFTSSALAVFSKKANRTLVHRFRKPVRDVLQQVSQNGRKRLLRLVPGLGRHVGRLLVDALIYLDFDGLIGEFDALLSDRNTNGGVKELIRRHKYLRQRTSGGRQWPELYDEMSRMLAAAV